MNISDSIVAPLRRKAFLLIYLQLLVMLGLAIVWFFTKGAASFGSALLGGIAWTIPNFYFIRKIFNVSGKHSLDDVAKNIYLGETVKLLMSGILIVLFIKIFSVDLLPFLSTFIGVVMASFFMPVFLK